MISGNLFLFTLVLGSIEEFTYHRLACINQQSNHQKHKNSSEQRTITAHTWLK
jgi:hypothetical protein